MESRRISQQLQLWETTVSSTPAPENLHDPRTRDVDHLSMNCNWRIIMIAGTSTAIDELPSNCNCGASTVFCLGNSNTRRWTQRACQRPCPRTAQSKNNGHSNNLIQELHHLYHGREILSLHDHRASTAAESGTNTTCTTGTSTTRKTRNNCGTTAVFCTLNHGLSLNTTGMSTTLSRLQLWELDCLP